MQITTTITATITSGTRARRRARKARRRAQRHPRKAPTCYACQCGQSGLPVEQVDSSWLAEVCAAADAHAATDEDWPSAAAPLCGDCTLLVMYGSGPWAAAARAASN